MSRTKLTKQEKLDIRERLLQAANARAKVSFRAFVELIAPLLLPEGYKHGKHIDLLCREAQELVDGTNGRLQVWISPRSMKSILMNVLLGAWVRGRFPYWDIICVSNSADNAKVFSKQVQEILALSEYQGIFPGIKLKDRESGVDMWRIEYADAGVVKNGGLYKAAGAGTKIAGRGAHIAIIDDPISEQEAESPKERQNIHNWFPGGLRSRLAPDGRIIIINTRWHEDDLSGHLISKSEKDEEADQWRIVSIPAILDAESAEMLGLPEGGSYWPERWSLESLKRTKANTPPTQWSALYMQDPRGAEGGLLNPEMFRCWSGSSPPKVDYIIMSMDTAFSEKETADFSVIQTWGIFMTSQEDHLGREQLVPNMIMLGNTRGRWAFPELEEYILKLYDMKKPDLIIVEKKASGQSIIQVLQRRLLPVHPYTPDRDKLSRAHSIVPLIHSGRIWLPEKEWAYELMDECDKFPNGKHDDQVDAFVQAAIYLRDSWKVQHYVDKPVERNSHKKAKTYWSSLTAA